VLTGTATHSSKRIIQYPNTARNANSVRFGSGSAVQSPAGASLGNKGNLASRAEKTDQWRKRFRLLNTARELLPDHKSIQCCMKHMQRGVETATIESNGDKARITGVHRCNYGYICPVCAPKIAMSHARELAAACAAAYAKGWKVYHITYTLSHHEGASLDETLKKITDARRKYFLAGRGYQEIKEIAGIQGSARALETTHGANGWHPHFHELLFISGELPLDFEATMSNRWLAAVSRVGGHADQKHGLRVETGSQKISEYLNKFGQLPIEGGHSVEMELSHGHTKIARKGGASPFALLDSARSGNENSGLLFREYARAMRGKAVIRWSKGLREVLGVAILDTEAPDGEMDAYVPVAALSKLAMIEIAREALLPSVLTAAVAGYPVLVEFLSLYDINPHPRIGGLFIFGRLGDLHKDVWA